MKKNIIIILFILTIITFVGYKTYSYYFADINVNVSANASNIICDAEILEVNPQEKNIYGYSEFKVRVKNYDSSNNISAEKFDYTLTIENQSSLSAEFSNNGNFTSSLVINESIDSSEKEDNDYIIQVKSTNGLSEDINYKVDLNCVQGN